MKIQIIKSEYSRYLKDLEKHYLERGLDGLQMFCVCSSINLIGAYSILNDKLQKQEISEKIDSLIEFYDVEVI